ncbi:helix-turn-helix domain-containing protein [Sneathiella sp. DP05]|uniref:Helix-turn-helix domain-containing protein n=2 Tax=Sneathiella litorea TaxID=2606216 RepID=A0A6L8W6D6_9PROT|nr:helix-turn-helix domain-containing protein [Sneathiella litorea]
MSASAAMEPLRAANLFAPKRLYELHCLSLAGESAKSSLPAFFETTPIQEAQIAFDMIFVVAGGDPFTCQDQCLFDWLHKLDQCGVALGGISGGAGVLAEAGLLNNRRFTLHWHHFDDLNERHPAALVERRLFVIDRDRYTCAGGTAPLDMMHAVIASKHGSSFAQQISDWFIHTEIRAASAPQQASVEARFGALPKAVVEAIDLMESHLADPLSLAQIASLVGLSKRQLQRQFHQGLGQAVAQTYREIRLKKAYDLTVNSALPAKDITEVTGFATSSSFSVAFAAKYGEGFRETRLSAQRARALSEENRALTIF